MNLLENVRLALEGLRANKMRALLTMLGIIIGIGSVIGILTVGESMRGSVSDSMSALGASNIIVSIRERGDNAGPPSGGASQKTPQEEDLISADMIEMLTKRYPDEVLNISLTEGIGSGKIVDGRKYANVSVTGTNDGYDVVNDIKVMQGRFLSANDIAGARSVAVVSNKLVNNIFGGDISRALGKEIKLQLGSDIRTFTVVGVYEYVQNMMNMSFAAEEDIRTGLYIPVTTAKRMVSADDGYQNITVMAGAHVDSVLFATQLEDFFAKYYEKNMNYQCSAMSMEGIADQFNSMMETMNIAISVIAGISLLVGGIGVMNIMLVSVTERTREIGTRKALGATNKNIRMQFIVESTIVCMIGGIFGVVLGGILGYAGSSLIGTGIPPTFDSIIIAVGFSMAIGVFFGYYPANKAAKLDPIEALRYE